MAEEFNMNLSTAALNGGEDYELLFTVPLTRLDDIQRIEGIHLIGHITEEADGHLLVARDGTEITLVAQGWNAAKALNG